MSGILRKSGRYRTQSSFIFIKRKKKKKRRVRYLISHLTKAPKQSAKLKVMKK